MNSQRGVGRELLKPEQGCRHYMDIDVPAEMLRVDTARYYDPAFATLEREAIWRRSWQVACRADDVPNPGDFYVYDIDGQSYVITRDERGEVHGFFNACRHRGNLLCKGSGNNRTITCPYHLWQYGIDGRLLHVSDLQSFVGLDIARYGLKPVRVGVRCGFVFINPDPAAGSLEEYLGPFADLMDKFNVGDMVPVGLNASQRVNCNWKIVMDAFSESYHVQGIHPQNLPLSNDIDRRFSFFDPHSILVATFGSASPRLGDISVDEVVEAFGLMEQVFKGPDAPNPMEPIVAQYRDSQGKINFPEGTDLRILAQRHNRAEGAKLGLDYSRLTDAQLTDVTRLGIFPNLSVVLRANELNLFRLRPDPDGDPEKCILDVGNYRVVPDPIERAKLRTPLREVPEDFSFGLAVDQDREMMPRQQLGLRSRGLDHAILSRQELAVAHFHAMLDKRIAAYVAQQEI